MVAPRGAPTDSPPLISQADLESRAREVLDSEVEKLRQKIDEEGGELVFTPDELTGAAADDTQSE